MKRTSSFRRRSIAKLLELMLNNQQYFNHGLCVWVRNLSFADLIDPYECDILLEYIKRNRPSKFISFYSIVNLNHRYYWTKGSIKPRVKWVKKHIKKN